MNLFAEGIRSGLLPCSYSILLVGLATVVLRRRERTAVLWIFAGCTAFSAWLRAAGISDVVTGRVVTLVLVLGGVGLALLVNHRAAGLVSSALIGLFAGATWQPCVGEKLGEVLNLAPDDPLRSLLLLAVYLLGVMIPLVAVVALAAYAPAVRRWMDSGWAGVVSGTVLAAVGVLVLTDNYDSLLSTLARWSTP